MKTDHRFTLLALSASLLLQAAFAVPASGRAQKCGKTVPREGPVAGRGGLRLGNPVEFDDGVGISGGRCYPLYARGVFVAWVDSLHAAGPKLFVRRCVEESSITDVPAGARGGRVEVFYEEMVASGPAGEFRFDPLEPPLWEWFANPSFCGSSAAYWGVEVTQGAPTKVYAVVFDLAARRVVKREYLGAVLIESDSRGFFPAPAWRATGNSVTFDAGRAERSVTPGLRKVTLSLRSR
ncbi:MAG TPA: hypothetical protein VK421_07080 [Pyrinomonadaceae bacterium]|nr:hypothetical protein [Pyrinomonadaceae bacterium]